MIDYFDHYEISFLYKSDKKSKESYFFFSYSFFISPLSLLMLGLLENVVLYVNNYLPISKLFPLIILLFINARVIKLPLAVFSLIFSVTSGSTISKEAVF